MNRKALACAAAAAVAGAGPFAVSGPAAAAPPAAACRTAVTTLVDRPDSGFHGDWAKDAITRTVQICEAAPPVTEKAAADKAPSTYTATVVDTGTFTTVAGNSPGAGKSSTARPIRVPRRRAWATG